MYLHATHTPSCHVFTGTLYGFRKVGALLRLLHVRATQVRTMEPAGENVRLIMKEGLMREGKLRQRLGQFSRICLTE
jgi:hypothetical protein